jgi:hypothetical protein
MGQVPARELALENAESTPMPGDPLEGAHGPDLGYRRGCVAGLPGRATASRLGCGAGPRVWR